MPLTEWGFREEEIVMAEEYDLRVVVERWRSMIIFFSQLPYLPFGDYPVQPWRQACFEQQHQSQVPDV